MLIELILTEQKAREELKVAPVCLWELAGSSVS